MWEQDWRSDTDPAEEFRAKINALTLMHLHGALSSAGIFEQWVLLHIKWTEIPCVDARRQIKAARAAWAQTTQGFVHWAFAFEIPCLRRVNFAREHNDLLWEHRGVQASEGAEKTADCPVCHGWSILHLFPHLLFARSTTVLCDLPHRSSQKLRWQKEAHRFQD